MVSKQLPASQQLKIEITNSCTFGKPGIVSMESHRKVSVYKESPRGGARSRSNSGNNDHHYQRNAYR